MKYVCAHSAGGESLPQCLHLNAVPLSFISPVTAERHDWFMISEMHQSDDVISNNEIQTRRDYITSKPNQTKLNSM